MPYRTDRQPATVTLVDPAQVGAKSRKLKRFIVLRTGRGDQLISAQEARQLARELQERATEIEIIDPKRRELSSSPLS